MWHWRPIVGMGVVAAGFLIIVAVLWAWGGSVSGYKSSFANPEVVMAVVIVLAIIALMLLLYFIASGFSRLRLANSSQALGLPEGSIRAMIALILIMVFIILGVYLFRSVAEGEWDGPMHLNSLDDVRALAPAKEVRWVQSDSSPQGGYQVWFRTPANAEGARLGQQLVTTVGTLVVAVAGFYFGSSAFRSGVNSTTDNANQRGPIILSIDPTVGRQRQEALTVKIRGRNLRACRSVRLVRGDEWIPNAGDVSSTDTEAKCDMIITAAPGGAKWSVEVENENGLRDVLADAFTISP